MNIKNYCLRPISVPKVTGTKRSILRCGKCAHCLRQKRNELAVRAMREMQGKKVVFLTFTYTDDTCPVYHLHQEFDENGVIYKEYDQIERFPRFFKDAPFVWVTNKQGVKVKRYKPLIEFSKPLIGLRQLDTYYQSIDYEDVKKLFKRFRASCPGALGSFICVPEYGSCGYRPHYHFFGEYKDKKDIEKLVDDWSSRYGHVDVRFPSDYDDVAKLAAYVSKYCAKGKFDCPYIVRGYCKKPRRSVSCNYGLGSDAEYKRLFAFLCAYDVYGDYDPLDAVYVSRFNKDDLELLARRRVYQINGFYYPLPKFLVRKIFYHRDKYVINTNGIKIYLTDYETRKNYSYQKEASDVVKYRLRSSELQKKIAKIILGKLVDIPVAEYGKDYWTNQFDMQVLDNVKIPVDPFKDDTERIADNQFINELQRSSYY